MRLRVKIRVFALVAIVAPLLGATPEDNFEKLYGDQAKRVQVSRDPKKIEEFAEGLIKDAGELKDDTKFQAVVFTKAYEIALKGGAYPAAQEAMEKLSQAQPDLRREDDQKLLVALEREHRPALRAKLDATRARVATEKRLEHLEQAVQKIPNKKDATEIIRLLLLELDDPAKASSFVDAAGDVALTRVVKLAGKQAADLPEADAKDLADWYQASSKGASSSGKAIALGHAKACYEQFLSVHTANDANRLEVKRRLDALAGTEAATAKLTAAAGGFELLPLLDLSKDLVEGKWTPGPTGLTSPGDNRANRFRFPYQPPTEYDLRATVTFVDDVGGVAIIFAHNEASGHWVFAWGDTGRGSFDGDHMPSGVHGVTLQEKFPAGSKHELLVNVRNESIKTFIDGKPSGDITGDYSRMREKGYWAIGPHAIGMWSSPGTVTIHSVSIVEISGRGMRTR